eukprot:COSAG02_NODE_1648_length_11502_cov_30.464439_2_plen_60_part_00
MRDAVERDREINTERERECRERIIVRQRHSCHTVATRTHAEREKETERDEVCVCAAGPP